MMLHRNDVTKTNNYKLMYRKGGCWLERIYRDTIYANVKRVAASFPSGTYWYIETM